MSTINQRYVAPPSQAWTAPAEGRRLDGGPSLDAEPDEARPSIQAQMADVQDEMATLIAQFGRRRDVGRKGSRLSEDVERILEGEADERIDQLAQLLKVGKANLNELLRQARRQFPDDSDLLLALRELRRRKRLDSEAVDLIDQAMEDVLRSGDTRRIKAGINAALKARVFGKRMQLDPARLRDLYRQFLEFQGESVLVYEDWIDRFGANKRRSIIDYVQAALVYDMQSLDPSCQCPAEFGPLLSLLGQVRVLSSADGVFVGRLLGTEAGDPCRLTEERSLKLMLGGLKRPFAIDKVLMAELGPSMQILTARGCSELLQGVFGAFSSLPMAIYTEPDARHALLAGVRQLSERFYELERRIGARRQGLGEATGDAASGRRPDDD